MLPGVGVTFETSGDGLHLHLSSVHVCLEDLGVGLHTLPDSFNEGFLFVVGVAAPVLVLVLESVEIVDVDATSQDHVVDLSLADSDLSDDLG